MPLANPLHTAIAVALSISLLGAAGCGTHIAGTPSASGNTADVTGSWLFTADSAVPVVIAGLTENAGSVTGTATIHGCGAAAEQTLLQGAVDSKGELTLQTNSLAEGPTLRIGGQLSADGKTLASPTITASKAGCGFPSAQKVKAEVYAPAQGSYTGNFTGSDGVSTPVAAVLTQAAIPGPGGTYTLGGSVAFPDSPCLNTAAINSAESTVTGGALSATYNAIVSGQAVTITATGTSDPSATTIRVASWTIRGGPCDGYSGTGTLTAG